MIKALLLKPTSDAGINSINLLLDNLKAGVYFIYGETLSGKTNIINFMIL